MELKWEYSLPTNENSKDFQYESPIMEIGDYVYFVSTADGNQTLHIICKNSGEGCEHILGQSTKILPSKYFFLPCEGNAVIYAGDLHFIKGSEIIRTVKLAEKVEVTSHLLCGNRLYIACCSGKTASLNCVDLEQAEFLWTLDISNTAPYSAGELNLFDGSIACFGKDRLLFIDPENGEIADEIKIPRIDKLFCPIRTDEDSILIGYTNWSNAGILKYQPSAKKVVWRHKRSFEGPQLKCRIYLHNEIACWVKNTTELIALNTETGEDLYRLRTAPWLYTDLNFIGDGILYGTAGADGYLNYLDSRKGEMIWSAFLKNGCAYYDICGGSVFVGDFTKSIKQFSLCDGTLIDELPLDGEIVGQITASEECLYAVVWGNAEKDIRLVRIQTACAASDV